MKNYLLILNGWKATPAIFNSKEAANAAAEKTKARSRRVYKCDVVDESTLQHYVETVFGNEYYAAYDVFDGVWYVHERAPYDNCACDWCSLGGSFCEYCDKYGEDPYENCGKTIDFALFLEWVDEGGTIFNWESFLDWVDEGGRAEQ